MMKEYRRAAHAFIACTLSSASPIASAHDVVLQSIGVVESDADAIMPGKDGTLVTLQDVRWNGSGVMISPCLVLTANHVIFGNTGHYDDAYEHDIRFSERRGPRNQLRAHPVAHGILPVPVVENGKWKNEEEFKAEDWAIIRIDNCHGRRRARHWLALSTDDMGAGTGRLLGFYDEAMGNSWSIKPKLVSEDHCAYRAAEGTALAMTSCRSREGMSGGPLVTNEGHKVAAIVNSNGYGVIDGGEDELKSPSYLLTAQTIRRSMIARNHCDILRMVGSDMRNNIVDYIVCGLIKYATD